MTAKQVYGEEPSSYELVISFDSSDPEAGSSDTPPSPYRTATNVPGLPTAPAPNGGFSQPDLSSVLSDLAMLSYAASSNFYVVAALVGGLLAGARNCWSHPNRVTRTTPMARLPPALPMPARSTPKAWTTSASRADNRRRRTSTASPTTPLQKLSNSSKSKLRRCSRRWLIPSRLLPSPNRSLKSGDGSAGYSAACFPMASRVRRPFGTSSNERRIELLRTAAATWR